MSPANGALFALKDIITVLLANSITESSSDYLYFSGILATVNFCEKCRANEKHD